jgi:peptidoglycan hydrolase-like protein with peptidoglycan-binding domain
MRANADTALANARGTAERALRGDTSTAPGAAPNSAGNGETSTNPSSGEAAMSPARGANFDLSGLSNDQVKELQTALNSAGCKAGPVDGVVGPRTQHGIACGMQKNHIAGQDTKALYQALHLNFGG